MGINQIIISRIESENLVLSIITQLKVLSNTLKFKITDMFIDKMKQSHLLIEEPGTNFIH